MRKRNKGKALSRPKNQREALLKSLATSLFMHGKIVTTHVKAKELRPVAEKFITRAKKKNLANIKLLHQDLSAPVVKKLINEIAKDFEKRPGGYTRITKMDPRKSDGTKMVVIELVK